MKKVFGIILIVVALLLTTTPVLANGEPVSAPTPPDYFRLCLPDTTWIFFYQGKATDNIDVSDGTWRIQIPKGTWILNPDGSMVKKLVVDENGDIFCVDIHGNLNDVTFVYHHSKYPMYVIVEEVTITKVSE